jgi:hypothetical protein
VRRDFGGAGTKFWSVDTVTAMEKSTSVTCHDATIVFVEVEARLGSEFGGEPRR